MHILSDETYDNLVAALLNVEGNPATGEVTANEIIWTLADAMIFPARSEPVEPHMEAAA